MSKIIPEPTTGQRGPIDHTIRDQIVSAANQHFSQYGYGKTTVSDLAKAIGFSKAYIYKFFDSKQAIGEAICTSCLAALTDEVLTATSKGKSATEKLRLFFKSLVETSVRLFFNERKLYDIAAYSVQERWASSGAYCDRLELIVQEIILEGRQSGEFERKTPLDETCRAILYAMEPFTNPVMLQHSLDALPDAPSEVTSLILRSLAP